MSGPCAWNGNEASAKSEALGAAETMLLTRFHHTATACGAAWREVERVVMAKIVYVDIPPEPAAPKGEKVKPTQKPQEDAKPGKPERKKAGTSQAKKEETNADETP